VAVATATPAEIWLSCAHRYSATENDLVAFFDGFDVVRGSVRLVSPAWQCVRNGRYVFICIAVWVLCHLHAHCTACPNLIPRFGTTVDGRPSGEGWVSPLHPAFFSQQEPEFLNLSQYRRPSSLCQVGFSSLSEAQRAMKDKDRQHIGDRYVEIFLHQVRPYACIAGVGSRGVMLDTGWRHGLWAEVCSRRQGRGRQRWWLFQTRGRCWGRQREDEQR